MKTSPGSIYEKAHKAGSTEGAAKILQLLSDLGQCVSHTSLPVRLRNLHTGRHQKAAGAWSWILLSADDFEITGSPDTVRDVLCAHKYKKAVLVSGCGTSEIISDLPNKT
jgi:hypothetical protein